MTAPWWKCKSCGTELYDSQGLYAHRQATGHPDAAIVTAAVGAGPGSTRAGRDAAKAIYRAARAGKRGTDSGEEGTA